MFLLIGVVILVGSYFAYTKNMLCGVGLCPNGGSSGGPGSPAVGAAFIPTPNTTYYLAENTVDPTFTTFPVPGDTSWTVTSSPTGTNQWVPGGTATPPSTGPASWLAAYAAGQTISIATYTGAPGASAASYLTSYGPLVSF